MADQTGDSGTGMNPGGMPQGDSSQQTPQRGQTASFSFTAPRQPQARAPQQQAPRSNTKAQGPEAAKAQKIEIEGLDPKTLKELSAALKDLTAFNTKHTTSVRDMATAVKDLGAHLAAMGGTGMGGDFGARRFRTMQETVQSLVEDLDDVKDQYVKLIRLQKQLQASPDLLVGKNKDESLRFLKQAISMTKELQKSRDLDIRSVKQLNSTLEALETTYREVEAAQGDAFDAAAVKRVTEALDKANDSATKLKKTFEDTPGSQVWRGVKRNLSEIDKTFDNRFSKLLKDSPLAKVAEQFKGAFGKEARAERKETRKKDASEFREAWDARQKMKAAREAAKKAAAEGPKFEIIRTKQFAKRGMGAESKLTGKAFKRVDVDPAKQQAAVGGKATDEGNFAKVTIQNATIENLADILKSSGGVESGDSGGRKKKKQRGGARNQKQMAKDAIRDKVDLGPEAPKGEDDEGGTPKKGGRRKVRVPKAAKDILKQNIKSVPTKVVTRAAEGLLGGSGGALGKMAQGGMGRIAGAGLGRIAGMASGPLAVVGAIVAMRDMVAEQNKELNEKLAGGGINAGGVDFANVRKSLNSQGVVNGAMRGVGYKENMETMQFLMQEGIGLGSLTEKQAGRNQINMGNAMMTREEAIQGSDTFRGGGIAGFIGKAGNALSPNFMNPDQGDVLKRIREAEGLMGSVMKNANIYAKNVGMDRGQGVKLTMELLQKYQLTTQQTGDFFLRIDKAMRTAQISAAKYVEIVEAINSGFDEFNNTMRLTTRMLDVLGKNSRFTGDRMKAMAQALTMSPKQSIEQEAYTMTVAFQDDKTRADMVKQFEGMRQEVKDSLVEQSKAYSNYFNTGVKKNDKGEITEVTDLAEFERQLAALTRPGGALATDKTAALMQEQVIRASRIGAMASAQIENVQNKNGLGFAAVNKNMGDIPEANQVRMFAFLKSLAKQTGGDLTKMTSRDMEVRAKEMNRNPPLYNKMTEGISGLQMDEVQKVLEALTSMRSQVADSIQEYASKSEGEQTNDRKNASLLALAKTLKGEGVEEFGKDKTDDQLLSTLRKLAKGNPEKLNRYINNSNGTLESLNTTMGSFAEEIDRERMSKDAKEKFDQTAAATRTTADIFATAFEGLFQKLISVLEKIGRVINPSEWWKVLTGGDDKGKEMKEMGEAKMDALGAFLQEQTGKKNLSADQQDALQKLQDFVTAKRKAGGVQTDLSSEEMNLLKGLVTKAGGSWDTFGGAVMKAKDAKTTQRKADEGVTQSQQEGWLGGKRDAAKDFANFAFETRGGYWEQQRNALRDKLVKEAQDAKIADEEKRVGRKLTPQEAGTIMWRVNEDQGASLFDKANRAMAGQVEAGRLVTAKDKNNNGLEKGETEDIWRTLMASPQFNPAGNTDLKSVTLAGDSVQASLLEDLSKKFEAAGFKGALTRKDAGNGRVTYIFNNVDATTRPVVKNAAPAQTTETSEKTT